MEYVITSIIYLVWISSSIFFSSKNLLSLLEKLEDLDDVQNISSNFNINDSLMEKLI